MAKTSAETVNKIQRFIDEAKKSLNVSSVILYGSHAVGKAGKWSDIDVAVISNDFKDVNFHQRMVNLGKIAWQAKTTEIEALGFTEEEYKNATKLDFIWEIKKSGRIVA